MLLRQDSPPSLFTTQRDLGVDAGSAPRRDIAGDESDRSQKRRNSDKGHEIVRSDAEEQRARQAGGCESADDAENDSPKCENHTALSQQGEEAGRDPDGSNAFGFAGAGEVVVVADAIATCSKP